MSPGFVITVNSNGLGAPTPGFIPYMQLIGRLLSGNGSLNLNLSPLKQNHNYTKAILRKCDSRNCRIESH